MVAKTHNLIFRCLGRQFFSEVFSAGLTGVERGPGRVTAGFWAYYQIVNMLTIRLSRLPGTGLAGLPGK